MAAILAPLCLLAAIVLPLVPVVAIWRMPETEIAGRVGLPAMALPTLAPGSRVLLVALGTLPVVLLASGLLHARRALRSFSRGEFFGLEMANGLRGLAGYACAAALCAIVASALASVVLTYSLGPGSRRLALSVSSGELLELLTAALVWLISGVLAEAQALADENSQFV